ncbi:MAG: flippase-like domain-containing protein [Clostridia bacterium]|nr:flippase-like domain-containing protein [Clostridia bacterium]
MSENWETESEEKESLKAEIEEIRQEVKPANKKVVIFNFILILAIFIFLFIYMVKVDGIDNIREVLHQVDYRWVMAGLVCLVIHWICEANNLHIPIKKMYPDQTFANSFKVSMLGQLFNNITPFSTGGQPMQAYELTKTGKRVSDSLSAMAMKFIITQTALVVSTIIVVCFEFSFFANLMQNYIWIAIIGFVVNILAIIVVILAGIKKKVITFFTTPIIRLLGKIHIFKRPEETIEKLDKSIENFREQFLYMKSEKKMVLKMFITAVIQSFVYYSITYMVYRAFGNFGITFWQIIPTQAFLLLIMTFIPTPGSGLGAEGGFYLLFHTIFQQGTINMSILFWRMYTFYLPIIVGALFLIPTRKRDFRDVP